MFKVKEYSITSHVNTRIPNIVQNFWDELSALIDTKYFEYHVEELNYPFSQEKMKDIDLTSALVRIPENFVSVALDSGYKIGKKSVLYEIEHYFAERGFLVEGDVAENRYVFSLKNTKRGKWTNAKMEIKTEEERYISSWNENIYFGKSKVNSITVDEPDASSTKHYEAFKELATSNEFREIVEYSLKRKFFPFKEGSYLSS